MPRMKITIKLSTFIAPLLFSNALLAGEYLGFDLGVLTKTQALSILNNAGASGITQGDAFGGEYAGIVEKIEIRSFNKFDQFGKVKWADLKFTKNKLYEINVSYEKDEKSYGLLAALKNKYGTPEGGSVPMKFAVYEYYFYDGDTKITFLDNQDFYVSITYSSQSITKSLDLQTANIAAKIKKEEERQKKMNAPKDL
ncbi:hypothetical protein [Rheinheimera texasensis]|uniref:hypothetical protein n=1 Tax=Rheinheimera texasensis TaxID=306205 RepID=UPI0032B1878D